MEANNENSINWRRLKEGDKLALFDLYSDFYFHLYRFGINTYADSDLVKDCISQLFLKLWEKRDNLPEVKNVKSYLFTSLKRIIFDFINYEDKIKQLAFNDQAIEMPYEELVIRIEEDEELKIKIEKAMALLTPMQLKLIRLKFYENYSYEEIAHITLQSKKTIYNTIYDAIKILKINLSKKTF